MERTLHAIFFKHPESRAMSYGAHMVHAWKLGAKLLMGSTALCIHGAVPCLFEETGSNVIREAYEVVKPKQE